MPSKLDFISQFINFEKLYRNVSDLPFYDCSNKGKESILASFKNMGNESYCWGVPFNNGHFSKDEMNALQQLKKDNSLIITRTDKGNGVVLLNCSDYFDKINVVLDDVTIFTMSNLDPIN